MINTKTERLCIEFSYGKPETWEEFVVKIKEVVNPIGGIK